jgi:hypothetical protein
VKAFARGVNYDRRCEITGNQACKRSEVGSFQLRSNHCIVQTQWVPTTAERTRQTATTQPTSVEEPRLMQCIFQITAWQILRLVIPDSPRHS